MAQNIYDDPEFFASYTRLPRQVGGLAGAPEWPAIRAMLPDLAGKRVVDLGCGFGWFARWAREHGAASVLGIDLSERMIARARADTADPAIEYRIGDLEALELPVASFDFTYSTLAFHYIQDFGRLVRAVHRSLVPGAHLVFAIEHPIYMAATHPRWWVDEDGRKTWPVNRYSIEGERTTDWRRPQIPSNDRHHAQHPDRGGFHHPPCWGVCPHCRADGAEAGARRGS